MNKRILITGGSGFIGTNLVEFFRKVGWLVCSLDIRAPRNASHTPLWHSVDLLDRDAMIAAVCNFKPTVILHFGARTDLDEKENLGGYNANILGICNLAEAVKASSSVERIIIASSQLVCNIGYQPTDENDYRPSTLYGVSKVLTERIVRSAQWSDAIWTMVRPTSLWGPWFGVPYRNFFEAVKQRYYLHPGGITTYKQWGFIGNSVYQIDRLLAASADLIHRKTFYLADYEPLELRIFANLVQHAFKSKPCWTIPYSLLRYFARVGDLLKYVGWSNPPLSSFRLNNIVTNELQDLKPLEAITGALPYSIEQGIALTVDWMRSAASSDERKST